MFHRFKIGTRLGVAFMLLVVMLLAASAAGWYGINRLHTQAQYTLAHDVRLAQLAGDVRIQVLTERRYEKDVFINMGNAAKVDAYHAKWETALADLHSALKKMEPLADAKTAANIKQMKTALTSYAGGFAATYKMLKAGALRNTAAANTEFSRYKGAVHDMEARSEVIREHAQAQADAVPAQLERQMRATGWALAGFSGVAALLAIGLGLFITRGITLPLRRALHVAKRVASGDLSHPDEEVRGGDETAELLQALGQMNVSLNTMVATLQTTSVSIMQASATIADGNQALSERTHRQAAGIEQTAASIEQMTATVSNNDGHARQASSLANTAFQRANEGHGVLGQAVGAMGEIEQASQRIAQIVEVIDDIAFQTNLLALNASVEAARAGEQGKGFAVVAGEVRTLAERCAVSSRDIRSLIKTSGEKVTTGNELMERAHRALASIVEEIRSVDQTIGEVAQATREQSQGVDQINAAISHIDSSVQDNAALVERMSSSSQGLRDQAEALMAQVRRFKLKAHA
ncbi:methyl-accepting chemotaxis protein [Oleiagrimonas sp. C23AA]|uniref:methyl-accepting chemotaxis protein n=1 Tax=Oleiagrimonas sp. C23AA TaxID=2719047 RepID=UPI00141E1A07|nr:methyl-accepting chemotaxis protein [Oleiagrimonas sp. C23AA]NII09424.1 HAMP domain-containing protein [Oleiagrimonas sp. C23AA]